MEESVKYKKIYNILKKGGASITLELQRLVERVLSQ